MFASGVGTGLPSPITATGRDTGACNDSSNVDPVDEAHHCVGRRYVYDPCFGAFEPELLCVSSPWSRTGIRFHVRSFSFFLEKKIVSWDPAGFAPIPVRMRPSDEDATKTKPPWALELSTGERCVLVDGATFLVAGQRANYECSRTTGFNGGRGVWLIGVPDRTSQLWQIARLAPGSAQTRQTAVEVAWY